MNPLIKRWARLAAIAAVFLWTGCQNPSPGDVAVSEIRSGRKMHATLTVAPADDPNAVKSAFSGSDHTVANYNLLVFESGVLAGKYYKDSGSPLAFEVMADRSYNYYCVANTGDLTGAFTVGQTPESRMATWQVEAPVAGAAGLPMAWSGTDIRFSKAQMRAGAQLEIPLTRLVAQYDIVLDKSALSQFSFTATSLSICGPSSVTPFASSKAASVATRTDYAVPEDLDEICWCLERFVIDCGLLDKISREKTEQFCPAGSTGRSAERHRNTEAEEASDLLCCFPAASDVYHHGAQYVGLAAALVFYA